MERWLFLLAVLRAVRPRETLCRGSVKIVGRFRALQVVLRGF